MTKAIKLAIAGAVLGGLGYIFLTDQRKKDLAKKAKNVERVLSFGREVLTMEIDEPTGGGMSKTEYVDAVTDLYRLLPNMTTEEDIQDVRFKVELLAKCDRRWSVLASIVNEGTSKA